MKFRFSPGGTVKNVSYAIRASFTSLHRNYTHKTTELHILLLCLSCNPTKKGRIPRNINISNLRMTYPTGKVALDGIQLQDVYKRQVFNISPTAPCWFKMIFTR